MARRIEQARRPRGIVVVARAVAAVGPVALRQQAFSQLRMAVQKRLDDQLAVDGAGDGLTHARVGRAAGRAD